MNTIKQKSTQIKNHKETGHKLEESKATVITREENNFTKRICEVLKIV